MKKIFLFGILISFFALLPFHTIHAEVTIHLNIKTSNSTLYDNVIAVTPCDSDNAGVLKITAYCAILQSGVQSDWNWAWAPGAFLNSLGNIAGYTTKDADNNDVYHYWSWYLNGAEGMVGLNQYELAPNDLILLNFIDPSTPPPTPTTPPQESGGSAIVPPPVFNLEKAVNYLLSTQDSDGRFGGSEMYTDWAAIALGAAGTEDIVKTKTIEFMKTHNKISAVVTDNERRAMALLALGENPYSFENIDYITSIIKSFDGVQFGNTELINDDIFALVPLASAGYTEKDEIIGKDIYFLIARQKQNGSWENGIDITAAAIQALSPFSSLDAVSASLAQAKNYLKEMQGNNGDYSSVYSTSWVAQAMAGLGEEWTKGGNSPDNYLAVQQASDGGAIPSSEILQNRIWATSYAIPAIMKKPWSKIMRPVKKKEEKKYEQEKVVKKENEEKKRKSENSAKINTATAINAVSDIICAEKTKNAKVDWLSDFLERVFGF